MSILASLSITRAKQPNVNTLTFAEMKADFFAAIPTPLQHSRWG
jgi:hypothetical protein